MQSGIALKATAMKGARMALRAAILCIIMAITPLFGQHTQSLYFSDPGLVTPGTTFTISVNLSYSGYESLGFSYWFEVQNGLAPFLAVTNAQYFTFLKPNNVDPYPFPFNSASGATAGFKNESSDLGATVNPETPLPPGTYHITDVTFSLAPNAPPGTYILRSTTIGTRVSEVSDMDFNANPINPPGSIVLNVTATPTPSPTPPAPSSAVSRKTHGAAGNFDVNLPLTGTPGIECRLGGATNDHVMVATFPSNVTVQGNPQAAVTLGTGTIGSEGMSNGGMVLVNGNVVTVPLTNVTNAQTINVTLFGVSNGSTSGNVVIPMSILAGDTNGTGAVNSSDIIFTKLRVGQAINATNFRADVNAGEAIN